MIFPSRRHLRAASRLSRAGQKMFGVKTSFTVPDSGKLGVVMDGVAGILRGLMAKTAEAPAAPRPVRTKAAPGQFLQREFTNAAGTRPYRLYVPASYRGQPVPLIVMLHGCTQSPEDFAAGTRMNEIAEQQGFLVAWPGQIVSANPAKCWNWFSQNDQRRDHGEPSMIAGITRLIIGEYAIDRNRVYVAGMSAGGAAAAIMGDAYPDLYAAIGIHSGLPCGSATDLQSALAAMKHGGTGSVQGFARLVPAIVFHGSEDRTVHPDNADAVIGQLVAANPMVTSVQEGRVPGGHAYRRVLHANPAGKTMLEQWVIHNGGHDWSGGSKEGSYTDPLGPDASREMVRFFLEHRHV
jgi:poly(hydroxyalkanoate) depolymerase family esterase